MVDKKRNVERLNRVLHAAKKKKTSDVNALADLISSN